MRIDTFHPIPALLQVRAQERIDLIDPLALSDGRCLATAFGQSSPILVMHACSEDIEVLTRLIQAPVGKIHDTQIGLALLGHGLQLGYQGACDVVLNEQVDKCATRSDWLARPLSAEQLHYAAEDVAHLPALYEHIKTALQTHDLYDYFVAECDEACRLPSAAAPEDLWLDHGMAWRMTGPQRWLLKKLMAWREDLAIQRDIARSRVIKNSTITELVMQMPINTASLSGLRDMHPRQIRTHGALWLSWVEQARKVSPKDYPPAVPPPLPRECTALFDQLKKVMDGISASSHVPVEVLWRKRLAEKVVLTAVDHSIETALVTITGWRQPLLHAAVADTLQTHLKKLQEWGRMRALAVAG